MINKKFRENYFQNINTQNKGYHLGWMYADGNVAATSNQIGFTINPKDIEQVEKFKADMAISNNPTFHRKDDKYDMVSFHFSSKIMRGDLIKLGCTPKKSLTLQAPIDMDPRLRRHNIRGYFDGDGSIGYMGKNKQPQVTFVGTEKMLKWIQNELPVPSHIYAFTHAHVNTRRLVVTKQKDVIDLYDYLYKGETRSLSRKKSKFAEIKTDLQARHRNKKNS